MILFSQSFSLTKLVFEIVNTLINYIGVTSSNFSYDMLHSIDETVKADSRFPKQPSKLIMDLNKNLTGYQRCY